MPKRLEAPVLYERFRRAMEFGLTLEKDEVERLLDDMNPLQRNWFAHFLDQWGTLQDQIEGGRRGRRRSSVTTLRQT